ncbi:hypothetical protein N7486_007296 [Penicillium sp. IBT 16267x]|nr:hypothetical protein N7486_007296 [Penicillium sp. IBT 16267x]
MSSISLERKAKVAYVPMWTASYRNTRGELESRGKSDSVHRQRFNEVCTGLSIDPDRPSPEIKIPGLLQMMAIVSFHTFIKDGVDVVICEAHHGGHFDATNFVEHPVITAITKIGIDHVDNLGGSIKNIAWHKSGIFKDGALALSVPQVPEAEDEMRRRGGTGIPPEQRENCALATQIANSFLQIRGQSLDEQDLRAGIEKFSWPGRFDIVEFGGCTWYLDGAHNEMSMEVVGRWYERVADANATRVLIFAHFSQERKRDWSKILRTLGDYLQMPVQHVIFVQQIEFDHFSTPEARLEEYAQLWEKHWPSSAIHKANCVGDSINQAKDIGLGAQILVTGSLYLVEAALELVKIETRCQVCT